MPVGPEMPAHLAKRKRSVDDHEGPTSPPHKLQAATAPRTLGPNLPPSHNPDELDVDDSSDDGYGPSAGPQLPSTKPANPPSKKVLGPTPPPAKNPDELSVEDSSEDEYGPSIPKVVPKPSSPPRKRILGPAPPPANLSERPSNPANDSSSDSEDDYGPSLPPPPGSAAEASMLSLQHEERLQASSSETSKKPQRDDWMLVPPSDSSWSDRVDPTKLKNRKFASGKGAKAPGEKSGISAIWTETPEQKRQRLEDEVLGRKDAATSGRATSFQSEQRGVDKGEEATARRIQEYNERNRGKSLYEEKQALEEKGGKKIEEDDPSKRGFDREKDMALGGRLGHGQKKEMMAKAADFGTRFQKGKYL